MKFPYTKRWDAPIMGMLMQRTEYQSILSSFRIWISAQDIQAARLFHDKFIVFEFFINYLDFLNNILILEKLASELLLKYLYKFVKTSSKNWVQRFLFFIYMQWQIQKKQQTYCNFFVYIWNVSRS